MLCADRGEVHWDAALVTAPGNLRATDADLDTVDRTFHFTAYPGVGMAIFLAAPHRDSPAAARWFGRLARVLVGRRSSEVQSLRRVAQANPGAVKAELRDPYLHGWVNSISTLQSAKPVRAAGERLMPRPGIAYHTISGTLPRHGFESDGVVPVASTLLDGAQSMLGVRYGRDLTESPEALADVPIAYATKGVLLLHSERVYTTWTKSRPSLGDAMRALEKWERRRPRRCLPDHWYPKPRWSQNWKLDPSS